MVGATVPQCVAGGEVVTDDDVERLGDLGIGPRIIRQG